ncbi:nucleolar protein dao-5-like isoform X2 [Dermacentor albipictus]|uniref:nucleolar protein dao-5-like isoform X2 n=1 Tax=Dermacentor albipictus TaxID=60249 RepID=UPI0031FD375A
MRWFSGTMLQAIAEAHSRRVLLLVFIEGEDLASQNMCSTFEDTEVNKLLDVMGCVPIRLRANSSACHQFTLVYAVTAIPSTFFISSRGNLEASVVGFTDAVSFGDRLAALMTSWNLKNVDSDMRNVSEASMSVDRMVRLNRQPSSVRLPIAAPKAEGTGALPQQPLAEGVTKKRSKGGERHSKKKHKRQEANVQTSIVLLAEQATQINMNEKRPYNNLLQKLATTEEATIPPPTIATTQVHGDPAGNLAGDLASLMGDGNGRKKNLIIPPEEHRENPLTAVMAAAAGGASIDVEKKGMPTPNDDKSKIAATVAKAENGENEPARLRSFKASSKRKDENNTTMPWPPAAGVVRSSDVEHPASAAVSGVVPVGLNDINSVLCDVADGSALLIKFAVLAQEFADKVLGSSQYEHSDSKSLEMSAAEATKATSDVRLLAESAQKPKFKKEKQATKLEVPPPAKAGEVHARNTRQIQHANTLKRSCQLESLQENIGDAPEAIAVLLEAAFQQVGNKDPSANEQRGLSGTRYHKQQSNSDASQSTHQQGKYGSGKRKQHHEYPTKYHAGDSKKVAATLKKAGAKASAISGSSTREKDAGLSQLAQKIKQFESAAANASQDAKALVEKKAKRSKSASLSKPPANDNRAGFPENGTPRTHVQMPSPPPLPMTSLEQDVSVVHMRPGIDTITEEETGAIDSFLTSPKPTPPPPQSPRPDTPTQPEVQKAAEEESHKPSVKEPACETAAPPPPLPQPPPPPQQKTQAIVTQNRYPPQSRKSVRRPSNPSKSKEFLTARNSQLDDALVFGPTHRTSDDSATVTVKRVPTSYSRPREGRTTPARSPPYERLVDSDGDDQTVDDELEARSTPSAAMFRNEVEWINEMARTASRRTLLYRAGVLEESLNNLFRTLNDMEGTTMSLSIGNQSRTNITKGHAKAAQGGGALTSPAAPPVTSPSKQHAHVTISDQKEGGVVEEKANAVDAIASTKVTHRASLSVTNVRNRARSRPSASRLGATGGGRSPSTDISQASGGGYVRESLPRTWTKCAGTPRSYWLGCFPPASRSPWHAPTRCASSRARSTARRWSNYTWRRRRRSLCCQGLRRRARAGRQLCSLAACTASRCGSPPSGWCSALSW